MDKHKSQSGFAHLMILVIILVLALIGALGFVYWQNFIQEKDDSSITPTSSDTSNDTSNGTEVAVEYKTYTTGIHNVSFQYPSNWTLGELSKPWQGENDWNRSMNIKNDSGEVVAELVLGVSGLGGTCSGIAEEDLPAYSVIDSEPSSVKADKPVVMSFIVSPTTVSKESSSQISGAYYAYYGLSDTYNEIGDFGHVCLFYNMFEAKIDPDTGGHGYSISFGTGVISGNRKYFTSLDDAKKYIASDEYKAIKKMILSLTY